jgi:hypothetical protein
MTKVKHTADVGSPDPELKTSPIAEEGNEHTDVLRQEVPGEAHCYFNDKSYDNGTFVKSGTSILKCDYGIWVAAGPADPENP